MPVECERLQGFPDEWTRIPYRGKSADECPDYVGGMPDCEEAERYIAENSERFDAIYRRWAQERFRL